MSRRIRVGIGGWTYAPWRGTFYPPGLPHSEELSYASGRLSSLEINGTFYAAQQPRVFARWYEQSPEGFVFALKAPRYATHRAALASAGPTVSRFLGAAVHLREKLGPINWQLPADKTFDPPDFGAFLDLLPTHSEGIALRHAIEVRHVSFRTLQCVQLARERGVALVNAVDGPYPQISDVTASFVYARLMGSRPEQPLGYAAAALQDWAARVRDWAAGGMPAGLCPPIASPAPAEPRDVFIYFISGHKVSNPSAAQALLQLLG